uniref:Endoplasmic reticulum membrane sensor NFE2L1 n=1 Tax=Cyclopterus lumpus TaxID=8103 RepID=A0A8C3B3T1_CYCLU
DGWDSLKSPDIDLGAGREVFNYSNRQKESEEEEKPRPPENKDGKEEQESWRNGVNLQGAQPVDGETGESIPEQFPAPVVAPETASNEEVPSTSQGLALAPQLPPEEPPLDLEQQWQDIMAIMELQSNAAGSFGRSSGSTPVNQDVSLHQASLPGCSQDFPQVFNPQVDSTSAPPRTTTLRPSSGNSSNVNATFGATNLTGIFLPPHVNSSSTNVTSTPILPDPFSNLLEESMLDEISLLDLAMEEGFSQAQASQLEDELDSDSGLSLDSSRSPASPSSSETSCSSAASSSSTSATFSEEGAVGYSTDSEAATVEAEEGAVGGYQPGYSKLCRMSYQDPSQFHGLPQLGGVGHNHTYNLPLSSAFAEQPELPVSVGKKSVRDKHSKLQPAQDLLDKHASRDERRARSMKIPFANEKIINLPVEEFNELLAKHHLSEGQLALVRDIRRRGKNKMAAQNCRKRKLDTIINLEQGVQDLRRDKTRLLKEKMEFIRSIRQMKQKMQSLYQEVFTQLRDEEGRPYPPSEYSLQYSADGSVLIMPRGVTTAEQSRKPEKKQKDKKK